MQKENKFKFGDQVLALAGEYRGYKGEITDTIPIGILTDYNVCFNLDPKHSIRMREEDLVLIDEIKGTHDPDNILQYLTDEEIRNVCQRIWESKAAEKFTEIFNNRSQGEDGSWSDLIIARAAEDYTEKLLEDSILRKQFNEAYMSLMISELEKEKTTNDYEDLVREHIKNKLQSFASEYIQDHKEDLEATFKDILNNIVYELSVAKLTENVAKILSEYISSILDKSGENDSPIRNNTDPSMI